MIKANHKFGHYLDQQSVLYRAQVADLQIDAKAFPKQRPGANYATRPETREYEEFIAGAVSELMGSKAPIDFPVSIRVVWCLPKGRWDWDNLEKALWDALQKGGVLANDNLIDGYKEEARVTPEEGEAPFIWVRLFCDTKNYFSYKRQNPYERDAGSFS